MVTIAEKYKSFCISANTCHNVMGHAKSLRYYGDFMVELAEDNNLPAGLVVNRTYVHPTKSNLVPVTLISTNDYNVWIRQPLFAGELYEVEEQSTEQAENKTEDPNGESNEKEEPLPKFGPRPNFDDPNFDFKAELKRLPFDINFGDDPLSKEQQVKFLNIIYDNHTVFSLHDGDLGYCNELNHSIPVSSKNLFTYLTKLSQFNYNHK